MFVIFQHVALNYFQLVHDHDVSVPDEYSYIAMNNVRFNMIYLDPVIMNEEDDPCHLNPPKKQYVPY